MIARVACISIDLDEIAQYRAIYGLRSSLNDDSSVVHRVAGERFGGLCAKLGIHGTLFAIGEVLNRSGAAGQGLKRLSEAGHEIGNHTLSHDYRLTRWPLSAIVEEVAGGRDMIERAIGAAPVGFRAPGYNVSRMLLETISKTGHTYDSSTLPSIAYLGVRAAAIGALRLAGRRSQSLIGDLRAGITTWRPHRVPIAPGGTLVELPLSAVPGIPFIGTTINSLPLSLVRTAYGLLRRRSFLNVELHGIDLMDVSDGMPGRLFRTQAGVARTAGEKMERAAEVLKWIAADFEIVTLAVVAARVTQSAAGESGMQRHSEERT